MNSEFLLLAGLLKCSRDRYPYRRASGCHLHPVAKKSHSENSLYTMLLGAILTGSSCSSRLGSPHSEIPNLPHNVSRYTPLLPSEYPQNLSQSQSTPHQNPTLSSALHPNNQHRSSVSTRARLNIQSLLIEQPVEAFFIRCRYYATITSRGH